LGTRQESLKNDWVSSQFGSYHEPSCNQFAVLFG